MADAAQRAAQGILGCGWCVGGACASISRPLAARLLEARFATQPPLAVVCCVAPHAGCAEGEKEASYKTLGARVRAQGGKDALLTGVDFSARVSHEPGPQARPVGPCTLPFAARWGGVEEGHVAEEEGAGKPEGGRWEGSRDDMPQAQGNTGRFVDLLTEAVVALRNMVVYRPPHTVEVGPTYGRGRYQQIDNLLASRRSANASGRSRVDRGRGVASDN